MGALQGDFVTHLMENIAPELDKPASQQMSHNLLGYLESSIRATSVQFESRDILDRLQIQLSDTRGHSPGNWSVQSIRCFATSRVVDRAPSPAKERLHMLVSSPVVCLCVQEKPVGTSSRCTTW